MELYKKNWLILNNIGFVAIAFIISFFYPDAWQNEIFKKLFLKIGLGLCVISTLVWVFLNFKNYKIPRDKKLWLRTLIVVVSCCAVFLFTYKLSKAYKAIIILLVLCSVYALWKRQFIKPTLSIILLGIFALFKIIGVFWNTYTPISFVAFNDGEILFLLCVVVLSLFYRMEKSETMVFITICFKGFLSLLILNVTIYILYTSSIELPFFSFLTFNKGYMNYYSVLEWGPYQHPSYISWTMLLIGGLSFFVWKEQKEAKITTFELIWYAILLFCFAFMVQARITIIGYFLTISLLGWLYFTKKWTMKTKTTIVSMLVVLLIAGVGVLVTQTKFFSDPIRMSFFNAAKEFQMPNLFFGAGTTTQRGIAETLGFIHLHNDLLCIFIDLGIIGLLLLLGWIIATFYQSIVTKNNYILYTLLLALMFINTDTFLYMGSYMSVWFITILFAFPEKEKIV
ncbi:O-antigen ligase family protein [Capnocytophaga catalasegens]|uniref:O-antigen ligase-related domain-containing protein n=1 Tax=Capnocytophaga catalasegens TaxID=1004260 RepID=A0AAV5AVU2_9FLAO|nr:O-antigen ligase family protein [Capnocytophaga catalasegens]GIZ14547.1 hypothetical protein RCZ03_05480 [Capnocytophaga catalasegens]GJM50749.1 hypothetical protein RCZ15_17220 [Capnocytophaga catalasegens]GJM51902.1 hypothetical protein RCZ16_02200 [Capnocytophaga catalasegens]